MNEEHYLSDIRTAAAGAVAARMLAPSHVGTAAVLGAGVQAYWQPLALYRQRPFTTLSIWARSLEKAEQLKTRLSGKLPEVEIHCSSDIERTVRSADVLITATLSREPLVHGAWLHDGMHITAVGADDPYKCETRRDGASTGSGLRGRAGDRRGKWRCSPGNLEQAGIRSNTCQASWAK